MSDCCTPSLSDSPVPVGADCCATTVDAKSSERESCPRCASTGKAVEHLTVKSMLVSDALATIDVGQSFYFCEQSACPVVYYGSKGQTFLTHEVRVPVYQKDADTSVPVCYCFGWTRARLEEELQTTGVSTATRSISAHIKAGRCACEVNNPQGSCCLGNVTKAVQVMQSQGNYPE